MKRGNKSSIPKRVTLYDVAGAAGVSVMTVSNVINGKHAGAVGDETVHRVQQEVERLGYRPHQIARSLRLARSTTVGMLIVTGDPLVMAVPWIATMVSGVMTSLSQSGYNLISEAVHPKRFEQGELLQRVGVAGIIAQLAGSKKDRAGYQRLLKGMGLPLIFIQDHPLVPLRDCLIISQEDFKGGAMLAEHVLDIGARRLLFVRSAVDWPAVQERENGIRSVVENTRGASLAVVKVEEESFDSTQKALRAHFRNSSVLPDAILCGNDHLAVAAQKLVQSMGRKVPDDVNITGFNNFESRNYTTPTLTTVQSQGFRMGQEAGEQMTHRLTVGSFRISSKTFPVTLVLGGSTRTQFVKASPPLRKRSRQSSVKRSGYR